MDRRTLLASLAASAAALAADPKHARTWSYYGMWQAEQGNRLKAEDFLQKVKLICGNEGCKEFTELRAVIDGKPVVVTGIAKGAGMIRPNMATMLGFVATDAAVPQALLQRWVREAADASFNRITIDGDTSTNDSFVLIAPSNRSWQGRWLSMPLSLQPSSAA